MAESRQQRRARERAEAKAARRSPPPVAPGPAAAPPAAPAPKRQRVLEVELTRFDDGAEADEEPVAWHAEWALQGDDVATEDSSTDVSELINGVVEDAVAQWGGRYDLTIEWKLGAGDPLPEGQTMEGILNGLGVVLPRTVSGPPRLRKTDVRQALPAQFTASQTRLESRTRREERPA